MAQSNKTSRKVKIGIIYKEAGDESSKSRINHEFTNPYETTWFGRPSSVLRRLIKKANKIGRPIDRIILTKQLYLRLRKDPVVYFSFWISSSDTQFGTLNLDGNNYKAGIRIMRQ